MKLFDSGNCLESAALGLEGGTGTGRHATLSLSDAVRNINTDTHLRAHTQNSTYMYIHTC